MSQTKTLGIVVSTVTLALAVAHHPRTNGCFLHNRREDKVKYAHQPCSRIPSS